MNIKNYAKTTLKNNSAKRDNTIAPTHRVGCLLDRAAVFSNGQFPKFPHLI